MRIYDVTDILFAGRNAHMSFDIETGSIAGNYYFRVDRLARNYIAEVGLRSGDGLFHPSQRHIRGVRVRRVKDHLARFRFLADAIEDYTVGEECLPALEHVDNIFPDLYRFFCRENPL